MEHLYAFLVGFAICSAVAYLWYRRQQENED